MAQAVLKDTMVNISKTTGDGCWRLGIELKDIMFNTLKTALLQLFRPSFTFHSTCQNIQTACQVRIIFMKKNIFLHEEKYFSS
ncbi:hypothetical protein [Prevotella jejuni]